MTFRALFHHTGWRIQQFTICLIHQLKYHIKRIHHQKEPKPPYLFLGNHAHLGDPWFFGSRSRYPIAFMANEQGFVGFKKIFAFLSGAFPKKKGLMDSNAVRTALKINKEGEAVGIFPEGDRTWDGETDYIFDKIVKLVRKFNCDLRLGRARGSYLSWPRWAETQRRGRVFLDQYTIPLAEIQAMSEDDLYKKIKETLYQNDIKDPSLREVEYTGKNLAHGIQYLLWVCPECLHYDTLYGQGDNIVCSYCQKKWRLDGHMCIDPVNRAGNDLKDWSDWQKEHIRKIIENPQDSVRTPDIDFFELTGHDDMNPIGRGTWIYQDSRLKFEAQDQSKVINFEPDKFLFFVDNFNRNFDFGYDDRIYRILFHGKNCSKWIYFLRYLRDAHF